MKVRVYNVVLEFKYDTYQPLNVRPTRRDVSYLPKGIRIVVPDRRRNRAVLCLSNRLFLGESVPHWGMLSQRSAALRQKTFLANARLLSLLQLH
jgi:hypothetical protein